MRIFLPVLLLNICFASSTYSQDSPDWPKQIVSNGTIIKLYQPEVEAYNADTLKTRGAFSILEKGKEDPVFGALWTTSLLQTDREKRTAILKKVRVDEIKFAGDSDETKVARLKALLEKEVPKWDITMSLDELEASIEGDGINTADSSKNLSVTPPKILYANKPSTLVLIEGEPKLKENKEMGIEMVLNTPFTIVKTNGVYYLNGSAKWYSSKDIMGPWKYTKSIPKSMSRLDSAIKASDKKEMSAVEADSAAAVVPEIIVSKEPAELIQSNGEADFASISGTKLLYMTNTANDMFMNITNQQYYVLLSGRWYQSASLKGPWIYVASDQLPDDFSKIPENSEKDDVLSSVAGTDEAKDAVMDAQIPQTAKVDRKTATVTVSYDGDPKFLAIDGTTLQYAINTKSTVLLSNKTYYCVDNGIWFEAVTPKGPWTVSTSRPAEVSKIPATVPVYNVKYVYIYETTPQYVYVGYTPGYMGNYVYGGTVIYGTGYYYNPWYGPYYYPRPVTYGFGMRYNPYFGWSVGFHYSAGWFNYGFYGGGYRGGYWGPPMYRPPYYHRPGYPPHYRPPYYPRPGYRPPTPRPVYRQPNYGRNNNVYRNNPGARPADRPRPMPSARPSTQPSRPGGNGGGRPSTGNPNGGQRPGGPSTMPSTRPSTGGGTTQPGGGRPSAGGPATMPSTRPSNGGAQPSVQPARPVTTDRSGNVYQKDGNNWQQKTNSGWQNQNRPDVNNNLNRQQQSIDRGNQRTNNYNPGRQSAPSRPAQQSRPAPQRSAAPSRGGGGRR